MTDIVPTTKARIMAVAPGSLPVCSAKLRA